MKIILLVIFGGCLGYIFGLECLKSKPPAEPAVQHAVMVTNVTSPAPRLQIRVLPWSDLLGSNLNEYARNLRGIACPEETIYDIAYFEILREVDARMTPNWQMSFPAIKARTKEIIGKIQDAGIIYPDERRDFFLSSTQLVIARTSLQKYPISGNDANAALRLAMLAGFNTEQMIYYKSEFEHFGPTIVRTLAGFRPTQSEYYAMVGAMDKNSSEELQGKLAGLLTPDRYKEYLACRNPINIGVFELCAEEPRLSSKAAQMIDLLNDRTNLSVSDFRDKAMNLVGPGLFNVFVNLGGDQGNALP